MKQNNDNQILLSKDPEERVTRKDFSNDIAETISDDQINKINGFIERSQNPKEKKEFVDYVLSFDTKKFIDNLTKIDRLYENPEQNAISEKINEDLELPED